MLRRILNHGLLLSITVATTSVVAAETGASKPYLERAWDAVSTPKMEPQSSPDWAAKGRAVKMFFTQIFDKSMKYTDHAIPESDVANPVWNVAVDPKNAECDISRGSAGNTIMVKENGREKFALGEPTSDLSSRAYLYCGQALLRAGDHPASIPLVQFVNDVSKRKELKQTVEVDPRHVEIGKNPFNGNSMLMVDGRYPALSLSAMALPDAYKQLAKAREAGRMLLVSFEHGVTESGMKPSDKPIAAEQTASAEGSLLHAVNDVHASH